MQALHRRGRHRRDRRSATTASASCRASTPPRANAEPTASSTRRCSRRAAASRRDVRTGCPRHPRCAPAPRPRRGRAANDEAIAAITERAEPVPGGRPGHRLQPRPQRHPLRGRARARREGRARDGAREEPLVRGREQRGQHPLADPGQERHRHRDPEQGPRDRLARRRAALRRGRQERAPDDDRARQGRRGRLRRREPRQDAAPAGRRRDRIRQVELHQLDDHRRCSCARSPPRCAWC